MQTVKNYSKEIIIIKLHDHNLDSGIIRAIFLILSKTMNSGKTDLIGYIIKH